MIQALLFDLDGTLIDSDPIHVAVFIDFLAGYGVPMGAEEYERRLHGRLNADIFAEILPDEDPHEMSAAKEAEYRRRLDLMDQPPAIPGAAALIDRARARGWKLAVVTNAPRENAPAALAAVGLADRFDTIVTADDVPRGKPHPDPYLLAMRRLGVPPEACIVFEDSPSGLAAARAAGATVVGLTSSLSPDALADHGAALALADFTDPALGDFLARLEGAPA